VVNPILSCGQCELCAAGARHLCRDRTIIGVHRPGAFAERVGVPSSAVHPIPDSLSWKTASVIEPAANAIHAWALAGRPAGARVGVIGAGAIGLLCALMARSGGAESVAVADISAARRSVAESVGATAGTELVGEYDVVFDAVGSVATRRQSVDRLRPGGVAVWLGLADNDSGFDGTALVRTEKSVIGSFAYTDDKFAEAMRLVAGWRLDWVQSFPLDQGQSCSPS
jgi:threonine dehydrogenase-like Zn-dependent dehydrogenase